MKKIFTLLAAVIAALNSFAQISEGFNTEAEVTTIKNSCWSLTGFGFSNQNPIAETGSIRSQSGVISKITTPWLKVPSSFTVSFSYRVLSTSSNGAQKMKIALLDNTGETKLLDFNMNTNGNVINPTPFQFSSANYSGIKKILIEVPATALVQIDGLQINVPYYYTSGCNSAPVAVPDNYYPALRTLQVVGNVLQNDTDADNNLGEKPVSARLVSGPSVGTLTWNANGTFTYDPPTSGFLGGAVTFKYAVTDNGYNPLESNTTTVTLEYPEQATTLPVKLVSFAGKAANDKAHLNWMVADNENASYFEIEQSTNGYNFVNAALVFAGNSNGAASYQYAASFAGQKQYYRLKIWDKEGAFEYSNVIMLQSATAPASQTLKLWQAASNKVSMQFSTATAQKLQLTIVNLAGVVMHQQSISSLSGTNAPSVDLAQPLKPGVYLVQLRNEATLFTGKLLVP